MCASKTNRSMRLKPAAGKALRYDGALGGGELFAEFPRVERVSFVATMAEVASLGHGKARSMSICAAGSSSMEAIAGAAAPRRRRPAARSQSARAPAGRPSRRRPPNTLAPAAPAAPARYSSEPRLSEAETPPPVRRQASARRRPQHSPAHRRSTAFLDVPKTMAPEQEPDEDSYRLRTFNVNHKGGKSFIYDARKSFFIAGNQSFCLFEMKMLF